MTYEEHRERHKLLHAHFDELMADFLCHNSDKYPSSTTLLELAKWSNEQQTEPTERKA